ncbi:MAG: DUF4412 domain-containing protein [Candidatus Obscuribacter sp.]|nr:DUF4412 domain-containing protein [Candidatus Obscuribacter sp.]
MKKLREAGRLPWPHLPGQFRLIGLAFLLGWFLILCGAASAKPAAGLAGGGAGTAGSYLEVSGFSSQFRRARFCLSQDQVAVHCLTGSTLWSAARPARAIMTNPEAKAFADIALSEWIPWSRRSLDNLNIVRVERSGEETLAGVRCVHYLGYDTKGSGAVKSRPCAEFWCLPKPACSKESLQYWCKLFALPAGYGLPIKVRQVSDGSFVTVFSPLSVKTRSDQKASFELPGGYRKVKDRAALYFAGVGGELKASDLNEFFRGDLDRR